MGEKAAKDWTQDPSKGHNHAHKGGNVMSQIVWAHFGQHYHGKGVKTWVVSTEYPDGPRLGRRTRSANPLEDAEGDELI